jgi:serine/threonine protein kinase
MYEQSGTPAYIAPEIIRDKGYKGFKADLWSAGVVLFAMLYGTVPFKANNMKDLHKQIMEARYNLKDEISAEAKNLIQCLLNPDPETRYTVAQTLKHPWLQNADVSMLPGGQILQPEEQEVIRSEYTYNDPSRFNRNEKVGDDEPWDCFTELNLDSMNQTMRNASSKSVILAPFNSTMSDLSGFFRTVMKMAKMEDKRNILKFAARCRDQDRQYEINNNAELDNGVYHKFVYSSKDGNEEPGQNDGREQLLSRNSSRVMKGSLDDDLTQARKKKQQQKDGGKSSLQAEREALKAEMKRGLRRYDQAESLSPREDEEAFLQVFE